MTFVSKSRAVGGTCVDRLVMDSIGDIAKPFRDLARMHEEARYQSARIPIVYALRRARRWESCRRAIRSVLRRSARRARRRSAS